MKAFGNKHAARGTGVTFGRCWDIIDPLWGVRTLVISGLAAVPNSSTWLVPFEAGSCRPRRDQGENATALPDR
jgi:hypothetical protein